jgi:hypothetical protein
MVETDNHKNSFPSTSVSTDKESTGSMRPDRSFSPIRVLRGIGCALSILWLVILHVGMSSAPRRMPFNVKMTNTIIGALAIFVMFLCLRGWSRYALAFPFLVVVVWTLWIYWPLPLLW